MTHKLDADDFFIHTIQRLAAEARLNFFLVEPLWVEGFFQQLRDGRLWPRVLLNMHSEHHQPEDIFHRLVNLAAERGCRVIDPPDIARAAFDKARLHPRLVGAGIPVPWTVVVPRERPAGWRLSDEERAAIGDPFVIKPAMGYGRQGLVLEARSEADLDRSIAAWPDTHYLLQRRVTPREVDGRPLYFRAFHVFGEIWVCWWNCYTDHYRLARPEDYETHGLDGVEDLVRRIAALTGMTFFSTEVARDESGRWVVIDYVNDQCHMLSQTAHPEKGVPDELVASIARRLVAGIESMIRHAAGRPSDPAATG
jgi:hypothetical protein